MKHLVVVGGGWSGCAAALAAAKKGLAVTLIERTDRLLASGLVGGIMRNNGRYTAAEELILMGAGELVAITDRYARHNNIDFPGHRHASLYDVGKVELEAQKLLQAHGVKLMYNSRAVDVEARGRLLRAVRVHKSGETLAAAVFIDASGTAGPAVNCSRYGNGCAMCIYRCPTFGPRVSIAIKSGAEEILLERFGGNPGFFSGSCEIEPSSIAHKLLREIRQKGVVQIPLTPGQTEEASEALLKTKACCQYSLPEYKENIILFDTGAVKLMLPFYPLQGLRRISGMENAVYRDPLSGGLGNSIRFSSAIRRDNRLMPAHLDNLLVAGERAGPVLGHTEAMVTGTLAGYNAWRICSGQEPISLPQETVCGSLISFTGLNGAASEGPRTLYNLSGGHLFEYICTRNLYTTSRIEIRRRLERARLLSLFS
jgi:hypothetical protein